MRTTGRPSVGIRELKAHASAIVDDVKTRRVSYAVTKRGTVEALIVPADAGERLLTPAGAESGWESWHALLAEIAQDEAGKPRGSARDALDRMRR